MFKLMRLRDAWVSGNYLNQRGKFRRITIILQDSKMVLLQPY